MKIPKWTWHDIDVVDDMGYMIVPCHDENEVKEVADILKANNRCVQCGYVLNKDNEVVFFVSTKKKARRGTNRG